MSIGGSSGNDLLEGTSGNDSIEGFGGNDTLRGLGGNDTLAGGAGDDVLEGSDNTQAADFKFFEYFSSDVFQPGLDADVITTGAGFDIIEGNVEALFGDTITDFSPTDSIIVQWAAIDEARISFSSGDLLIDLDGVGGPDGSIHLNGDFSDYMLVVETKPGSYYSFTQIYFLSIHGVNAIGGAGSDFFAGSLYVDHIEGAAGDDAISAFAGNDVIIGGSGADTIIGDDGADLIFGGDGAGESSELGNEWLSGGAGDDTIHSSSGRFDPYGADLPYVVDGGPGDDVIHGAAGEELILDSSGSDWIDGGDGLDTLEVGSYEATEGRQLILDYDRIDEDGVNQDTIAGFEEVHLRGGKGDDTLVGAAYYEIVDSGVMFEGETATGSRVFLHGREGDDFLQLGEIFWGWIDASASALGETAGADTLIGGAYGDTFWVSGNGEDLLFTGDGADLIEFGGSGLTIGDFSNDDTLVLFIEGLNASNLSVAYDGTQTKLSFDFEKDGVVDTVITLLGSYSGGFTFGTPDLNTGTAIRFTGTVVQQGYAGGYFDDVVSAGSLSDVVYGFEGNDILRGISGDDTLIGGAGADTLQGGAGIDFTSYADASSAVSVSLAGAAGAGDIAQGDVLMGIERLAGSDFGDTLSGALADETIDGGLGADVIFGESGADRLNGDAGADTLIGGGGNDTLDGGADNDSLSGDAGRDSLLGGAGDDVLFGAGSHDTLSGGTGNDDLRGGYGKDLLNGSGGTDTLRGFQDDDRLFGGGGADTLLGNDGDDSLTGGGGADRLKGDAGNDTLNGSYGDDTVTGGAGDDVFQFRKTHANDTIDDFTAGAATEDAIQLIAFGTSFDTFAEVIAAANQVGADTVIDFGGGDTLTLVGVTLGDLHEDDFMFG